MWNDKLPSNVNRANAAERAVLAFRRATKTEQGDALADLLCDLMHLYGSEVFRHELARGLCHYEAETAATCAKCGTAYDPDEGLVEEGTGDESGKTFTYCSRKCCVAH